MKWDVAIQYHKEKAFDLKNLQSIKHKVPGLDEWVVIKDFSTFQKHENISYNFITPDEIVTIHSSDILFVKFFKIED